MPAARWIACCGCATAPPEGGACHTSRSFHARVFMVAGSHILASVLHVKTSSGGCSGRPRSSSTQASTSWRLVHLPSSASSSGEPRVGCCCCAACSSASSLRALRARCAGASPSPCCCWALASSAFLRAAAFLLDALRRFCCCCSSCCCCPTGCATTSTLWRTCARGHGPKGPRADLRGALEPRARCTSDAGNAPTSATWHTTASRAGSAPLGRHGGASGARQPLEATCAHRITVSCAPRRIACACHGLRIGTQAGSSSWARQEPHLARPRRHRASPKRQNVCCWSRCCCCRGVRARCASCTECKPSIDHALKLL